MQRAKFGTSDEPMTPYGDIRRMTDADYQASLQQQSTTVQNLDPVDTSRPQVSDAAKAVVRANDAGRALGTPVMDPGLVDLSNRIRANPQNSAQILAEGGYTRRTFLEAAQTNVNAQVDATPP